MKKSLIIPAAALLLASCSDDNNTVIFGPSDLHAAGAYVVCSGNFQNQIPGSVTSFDFANSEATLNAFQSANDRVIGTSVDDAFVYGDKLFIVSTEENTIEVCDPFTLLSIKQIKTTDGFGTKGNKPRRVAGYGDKIYVTTYGDDASGYVISYNTADYSTADSFTAGSYPEGLVILPDGKMYVANSDYGNGINPSVSVLNAAAPAEAGTKITGDEIKNPFDLYYAGGKTYLLDRGSYDASWNQTGASLYEISGTTLTKKADATMAAAGADKIFICNAPFHTPVLEPTYYLFDATTGELTQLSDVKVDSPAAVGVDPTTGELFLASYKADPVTGYANYTGNGYVARYTLTGKYTSQFTCGVGPMAISFNTAAKK